ncbi:hypothetical protein [Halobaculum sp. D14]|uniref:hypothetical protein n=1 Tax=Halobaculum sp. D14 TaxID=3421642 RepID=UPI003EB78ECB
MASSPTDPADDNGRADQFNAYSNYRSVTGSIASAIDDAAKAYAYAAARKAEGKSLRSDDAIQLRKSCKQAALMLLPELRANANADDIYQTILARWEENGTAGDTPADSDEDWPPYLRGIDSVQLRGPGPMPPWMEQFVRDIRQAGWEIGHLQAGETTQTASNDPANDEANAMLQD